MNPVLRSSLPRKQAVLAMMMAVIAAFTPMAGAIDIVFDYRYDTDGFFTANPTAKIDLEAAAQAYEMKLGDTLSAIAPGGSNSWTAQFFDPSTLASTTLSNLTIARDAILVFVGSATLGTSVLGQGGPGGFESSGSTAWNNTVKGRGQAGALASKPTDYSTWGGMLAFSNSATWYFDADPGTKEAFSGKNDFFSVALHELGHLLGIGTGASWTNQVSNGTFTGSASESVFGGAVPVDAGGAHWANGTLSKIYGTNTTQEAAMDPSLTTGSRKVLTALDVAGLQDIGWVIVPEPSSLLLLGSALVFVLGARRRR